MKLGPDAAKQWALFARVSQTLMGFLLAGMGLAYLGQKYLGLSEGWAVLFLFLSLGLAIREIFRVIRKLNGSNNG